VEVNQQQSDVELLETTLKHTKNLDFGSLEITLVLELGRPGRLTADVIATGPMQLLCAV
jgi:hypothetical protein